MPKRAPLLLPADADPGACSVPRGGGWRPGARWARADIPTQETVEHQIQALPGHARTPMRELGRRSGAASHPFKAAAIVVAAAAVALQPDRAMAGMLVLGLATLTLLCRARHSIVTLAASIISFAVTFARADTLPAVPHVERVFHSAFDAHAGAGLAVLVGSALLLVPAIVGWRRDAGNRVAYAAFGAVWIAAIMAAVLGNYPTPMVGYGGSAIIGYALSLLALPKRVGVHASVASRTRGESDSALSDRNLLVGLA